MVQVLILCVNPTQPYSYSKINSFLKIFHPTFQRCSSALWRRFFEIQEDEAEKQAEEVLSVVDEVFTVHLERPVASEEAENARKEFIAEHYRNISKSRTVNPRDDSAHVATTARPSVVVDERMIQHEQQQLNNPNLDIPVESSYLTLAQ